MFIFRSSSICHKDLNVKSSQSLFIHNIAVTCESTEWTCNIHSNYTTTTTTTMTKCDQDFVVLKKKVTRLWCC